MIPAECHEIADDVFILAPPVNVMDVNSSLSAYLAGDHVIDAETEVSKVYFAVLCHGS